jgi:hypothetical protein
VIFHTKYLKNFRASLGNCHLWTPINVVITFKITLLYNITWADPGFQVRGAGVLKKIAPSRGRHEIFGVFRVKNHDFTPKNHIFFNCRGRRENFWGISCEKSRFYAKKKSHLLFFHVNYLWFIRNTPKISCLPLLGAIFLSTPAPLTWNPGSAPVML